MAELGVVFQRVTTVEFRIPAVLVDKLAERFGRNFSDGLPPVCEYKSADSVKICLVVPQSQKKELLIFLKNFFAARGLSFNEDFTLN